MRLGMEGLQILWSTSSKDFNIVSFSLMEHNNNLPSGASRNLAVSAYYNICIRNSLLSSKLLGLWMADRLRVNWISLLILPVILWACWNHRRQSSSLFWISNQTPTQQNYLYSSSSNTLRGWRQNKFSWVFYLVPRILRQHQWYVEPDFQLSSERTNINWIWYLLCSWLGKGFSFTYDFNLFIIILNSIRIG